MEVQPNRVNKDDLRKFLSIAPGGISRIVGIAPRRRLQFPSVRDSVKGRTSISFSIRHAQDTPDRDQAQQGVGIRPAPERSSLERCSTSAHVLATEVSGWRLAGVESSPAGAREEADDIFSLNRLYKRRVWQEREWNL